MTTINTYTGQKVDLLDPSPANITLTDIAHGLAYIGRFVGHGREYYSVGLHSLNVSHQLKKEGESTKVQLYGLLHDASEAYIGDVPGMIKPELTKYQEIEDNLMRVIWDWSGLKSPTTEEYEKVSKVDDYVFEYEASQLLPSYDNNGSKNIDIILYKSQNFDEVARMYTDHAQNLFNEIS